VFFFFFFFFRHELHILFFNLSNLNKTKKKVFEKGSKSLILKGNIEIKVCPRSDQEGE